MEIRANLKSIVSDWASGRFNVTFEITEGSIEDIQALSGKDLLLALKPFRKHRSLDANALLWKLIGDISKALNGADKWDIYLAMLKRYGKYTYICVMPEAVDALKAQWRECEVVGERQINGNRAIEMLCYFGSSTYTTEEFSHLLDGVIEEMKEMKIPVPASEEMRRSLEAWEKRNPS